jgi:tripartite-type tricarboxylate transporter receptor subunit TctC
VITIGLCIPIKAQAESSLKPDSFPQRAVTIIVCFGAGGGADQMARAIAGPAEKVMGAPIRIVNKPGAGGLGCIPDFLSAPADGYTLLQHTDNLVTLYSSGKSDLNPVSDVTPLLIANVVPSQIYINAKDDRFLTNGKPDFRKVISHAKANPGQLTVANYGTPENMEGVTLAKLEQYFDVKFKVIAFEKAVERYGSVVGRKIDLLLEQPSDVKSLILSGDLAPVLSIWPKRFEQYSDTQAIGTDFKMDWSPLVRWRALFVQNDTPKEITDYLEAAFKQAWESKEHQAWLERMGMQLLNSYRSSEETKKVAADQIMSYTEVYRSLGYPSR